MLALNQGEGLGIKIHAFVRWVVRQGKIKICGNNIESHKVQ